MDAPISYEFISAVQNKGISKIVFENVDAQCNSARENCSRARSLTNDFSVTIDLNSSEESYGTICFSEKHHGHPSR